MVKKTVNPSQNWAAVGYLTEASEELDESIIQENWMDAAEMAHKFGRTWAVALSPLHTPDISAEKKEQMKTAIIDSYTKRINAAKSKEAKKKLELEMETEFEKIEEMQLKPHFHIQFRFRKVIRSSAANKHLEQFSDLLRIDNKPLLSFTSVIRIGSAGKYFEYLTHGTNWEKEQFEERLPLVYPPNYVFSIKQDTEEGKAMKLSEIEQLAYSGDFATYAALYRHIDEECKKKGALDWAMTKDVMRRNREHLRDLTTAFWNEKHHKDARGRGYGYYE